MNLCLPAISLLMSTSLMHRPGPGLSTGTSDALPRLGPGQYLGFIQGFEPIPPENRAAVDSLWTEATDAGMRVGRVQIDWAELEPSPGRFDDEALEAALSAVSDRGVSPLLTLSTLDSESYTLPEDLQSADGPSLANGMAFDDPIIRARFAALLDWLVPRFLAHGGWAISLGNEVDLRLEGHPEDGASIVGFVSAGVAHLNAIEADLGGTVTLSNSALRDQPALVASLMQVVDVACFNYYGKLRRRGVAYVARDLDDRLRAAGSLDVVLQEVGYPAGYEDQRSHIRSTPEEQQAFLKAVFQKMAKEKRLRAAVLFQFLDWSPWLTDLFLQFYEDAGLPKWFLNRVEEQLRTIGLRRWEDASARPAWNTFLTYVRQFSAVNGVASKAQDAGSGRHALGP